MWCNQVCDQNNKVCELSELTLTSYPETTILSTTSTLLDSTVTSASAWWIKKNHERASWVKNSRYLCHTDFYFQSADPVDVVHTTTFSCLKDNLLC